MLLHSTGGLLDWATGADGLRLPDLTGVGPTRPVRRLANLPSLGQQTAANRTASLVVRAQ
jgi:hypothetical protein